MPFLILVLLLSPSSLYSDSKNWFKYLLLGAFTSFHLTEIFLLNTCYVSGTELYPKVCVVEQEAFSLWLLKIAPTSGGTGILFEIFHHSPPKPTIPRLSLTSDTEHTVSTHWLFLN